MKLVQHIDLRDLPDNWVSSSMAPSVQAVGDAWVEEAGSLILQVPGAAVRGEYNYFFNPRHSDAVKAKFGPIATPQYEPWLGKE